jgi:penicillin-binding protein 2B
MKNNTKPNTKIVRKKVTKKKEILPERKEKIDRQRTRVIGYSIFFLFGLLSIYTIFAIVKLQVTNTYDGVDLNEYSSLIYQDYESVTSERGVITDVTGNQLAVNINTYDLYATLCDPAAEVEENPTCVSDGEATAAALLEALGLSEDPIAVEIFYNQLAIEGPGQVEFGTYGKDLTIEQKEQIEALKLPGIKFNTKSTRYYPYGDFASYVIGYVGTDEEGNQVGELGVEKDLDPYLKGVTGEELVSKDGNEVPLLNEQQQKLTQKTDGADVELTIDSQIQTFVQEEMDKNYAGHEFDQAFTIVMDVETGAILAMYALDSFDPNLKNVTNYNDPVGQFCYEPGSTIKTFVVATAMQMGVWQPDKVVPTGKRTEEEWGEDQYVADWLYNDYGLSWGNQPLYKGLYFSSNTIMTYILDDIGYDQWLTYLRDVYLFGKPITSGYMNTSSCEVAPVYPLDYANTSFGQGMTVNGLQMMRAYSIFGNDGKMVQPHYVNKMYDPETHEAFYDASTDKTLEPQQTISETTADAILKELEQVVYYSEPGMPTYYDGTDAILKNGEVRVGGKTGTAEISSDGTYGTDVISSNMVFAPIDDPEILVYSVVVRPKPVKPVDYIGHSITGIIDKTIPYLQQEDYNDGIDTSSTNRITTANYIGSPVADANTQLNQAGVKTIVIGSGNVEKQYPPPGNVTSMDETVVLKAEGGFDYNQMIGMSYNEAYAVCNVMSWNCNLNGLGNVVSITQISDTNFEIVLAPPAEITN